MEIVKQMTLKLKAVLLLVVAGLVAGVLAAKKHISEGISNGELEKAEKELQQAADEKLKAEVEALEKTKEVELVKLEEDKAAKEVEIEVKKTETKAKLKKLDKKELKEEMKKKLGVKEKKNAGRKPKTK